MYWVIAWENRVGKIFFCLFNMINNKNLCHLSDNYAAIFLMYKETSLYII